MTQSEITQLIKDGAFPCFCSQPELVETHISWVIICDKYVFKIKKPISYSFLNFLTLDKRLYYCQREVLLNQRLTSNMYLEVIPVKKTSNGFAITKSYGEILDYAVKMKKQSRDKQMDILLNKNEVSIFDIQCLAEKIAKFHKNASVINNVDPISVQQKFNDLANEKVFLRDHLGASSVDIINTAIHQSNEFIKKSKDLFYSRLATGFFRDGHGDLHTRNIFLLPEPVIFDCIEFNDEYRQIDILNEVAFLCMDLDAFGKQELSDLFITCYNKLFPTMQTDAEQKLFIYYKCYRANVRAKVNSLRAASAESSQAQQKALQETKKYLQLIGKYLTVM
jgi:uncharacterized protein